MRQKATQRNRLMASAGMVHGTSRARHLLGMPPAEYDQIERRVHRAIRTLGVQPDREASWHRVRSGWPETYDPADYPREERVRFRPTRFDMGDYLKALSWFAQLDQRDRRIVWRVAYDWGFTEIGHLMGVSYDTAKRRHENAIKHCWRIASARDEIVRDEEF